MLFHPRWDTGIIFTPAAANIQHLQRSAVDLSHLGARDDGAEFKRSPGTRVQQELLASIQGKWPGHGVKVVVSGSSRYTQAARAKANGKLANFAKANFDPG